MTPDDLKFWRHLTDTAHATGKRMRIYGYTYIEIWSLKENQYGNAPEPKRKHVRRVPADAMPGSSLAKMAGVQTKPAGRVRKR